MQRLKPAHLVREIIVFSWLRCQEKGHPGRISHGISRSIKKKNKKKKGVNAVKDKKHPVPVLWEGRTLSKVLFWEIGRCIWQITISSELWTVV